VAVRVHAVDHPAFQADIQTMVGLAAGRWCHIMLPKAETVADIHTAVQAIDAAGGAHIPVHALIESPLAVHHAFDIAAHPRVQSLSFGLMDFVSAHGGAIPASAMGMVGQFSHPLVVRAKLAIASACHAHGKTPSHCVVTEFKDVQALQHCAKRAANEWGFTRMWSIHPSQIRPLLAAFSPAPGDIEQAAEILQAAIQADWAPIQWGGQLHDRASFRFYWSVLERAHATGQAMPEQALVYFQA
jgi:citrate lyase subunit beta/citryl-CoA lyase